MEEPEDANQATRQSAITERTNLTHRNGKLHHITDFSGLGHIGGMVLHASAMLVSELATRAEQDAERQADTWLPFELHHYNVLCL